MAAVQQPHCCLVVAWQDAIESTGRKHTYLIVQWWLLGSLTAWLIGLVVSMAVSPALGFIIYIPLVALSLALGYTSSNVEYKVKGGTDGPQSGRGRE